MAQEERDFLRRWSRLKREAAARAEAPKPAPAPETRAPELPPVDSLGFESDFKDFMHAKVEESVKRAALKKLFADPRFNVMDGLDTYIDDYTKADPITDEMLATLEHAKATLFGPAQEENKEVAGEGGARELPQQEQHEQAASPPRQQDGDSRQDT